MSRHPDALQKKRETVRLKRWALLKTGLLDGAILTPWNEDLESSTRKQAAPLTRGKYTPLKERKSAISPEPADAKH